MIEAVRDTFWELLNMKDPNAGNNPYRVGRPKVQSAIKTYLGMGTPNVSQTELTPQKKTNAPKLELLPDRVQPPPALANAPLVAPIGKPPDKRPKN